MVDNAPIVIDVTQSIGKHVRRLRLEKGWSQEELAHKSGTTLGTIHRLEKELNAPNLTTVAKIAGALGVAYSELFEGAGRVQTFESDEEFLKSLDDD